MKSILITALLALVAVAGCLDDTDDPVAPGPEPSPAVHDILPVEEVWVESQVDGKRIHNAVYRPDTDERVPVWINFSPYWGDSATLEGDAFSQYLIQEYVPRGYAVVLSAIRGTGHSEGCFQIAGDLELQDTYDVVDHFAGADWSNGNIGAGGKSYDSTTQNGMIAKYPHPALKTIFHVSGISDMYRYNYYEGVPYTFGTIFNTYYYGQTIHEYGIPAPLGTGSPGGASEFDEDPESLARIIDDAACVELPEIQANGYFSAAAGQKTDYWIERDWTRTIGDSSWNGSIFFVHGWQDWNVKPDHIQPWLDELPEDIDVLGWLHQWQQDGTGHVYPMRDDWNATMLAWMDHYLKGQGPAPRLGFESQGSDDAWRHSPVWPPAHATPLLLDEEVACNATCSKQTVTLLTAEDGGLRMAGAPKVHVSWTAQSADPILSVVLYKVTGEERTWVGEGVLRGIYRDGLDEPSPVTPGSTYEATIPLFPLDEVLEEGESWELEFGGDPRHALTARGAAGQGDDVDPGDVFYDLDGAVFEAPLASVEAIPEQPEPMDCFAC